MTESLTPQVVVVSDIIVHVATGETCYPDENGFSAQWAEVTTSDPALQRTLSALAKEHTRVLLRCAMLDVTARVTKLERTKDGTRFVFGIDDLVYQGSSRRGPRG